MREIVINIDDNGNIYINGKRIYNNDPNFYKYKTLIKSVFENRKKIGVYTKGNDMGVIKFSSEDIIVKIEGYKNNKKNMSIYNIDLQDIIDASIYRYKLLKIKNNRQRKVKRIKTFAIGSLIAIGVSTSAFGLANSKDVDKNIDMPVQNEYSMEVENESIKDDEINYVYLDNNVDENTVESRPIYDSTIEQSPVSNVDCYDLCYEDRTDKEALKNVMDSYYNLIDNISNEYGIDPQIMCAIAAQESSGIHNVNIGGPAMGLMQIELSVWNGNSITAFNHKTNSLETLNITTEKLKDVEFNIRAGCMIFQDCIKQSNYNLELAIQMYNYGPGNINRAIKMCYGDDYTYKKLLENYDDGWLNYRENIQAGDSEYLEHIISYVMNPESMYIIDKDNNVRTYQFNNIVKKL